MAKIRGFKPDLWTDDDFVEVTPLARLLWMGMWNFACDNGHLQNKPKQIKMRVLPTDNVACEELIDELASQGLIVADDDWISVPNLAKHQKVDRRFWTVCEKPGCTKPDTPSARVDPPSARRVHDEDTSSARRDHASTRGDGDGDGELMVMVKGKTSSGTDVPDAPPRDDIERICQHLLTEIHANNPESKASINKTWRDAARLMLDRDGRTEQQIHEAIDWCQKDEFWRRNILSMSKLREKYDQMSLQARTPRAGGTSKQQRTEDILAAARLRMGVTA